MVVTGETTFLRADGHVDSRRASLECRKVAFQSSCPRGYERCMPFELHVPTATSICDTVSYSALTARLASPSLSSVFLPPPPLPSPLSSLDASSCACYLQLLADDMTPAKLLAVPALARPAAPRALAAVTPAPASVVREVTHPAVKVAAAPGGGAAALSNEATPGGSTAVTMSYMEFRKLARCFRAWRQSVIAPPPDSLLYACNPRVRACVHPACWVLPSARVRAIVATLCFARVQSRRRPPLVALPPFLLPYLCAPRNAKAQRAEREILEQALARWEQARQRFVVSRVRRAFILWRYEALPQLRAENRDAEVWPLHGPPHLTDLPYLPISVIVQCAW